MTGTPIVDFVKNYAKANKARFHMPGHKGVPFFGCEELDITEVSGADELYMPEGIILESERNAAELFGTARTVYTAGGSTQSLQAMLFTAYQRADKTVKPYVMAGRNAHKAFVYAAAKLDFDVEWLYPRENGSICSCLITPAVIEERLSSAYVKPFAVYITSPDYLGGMSDISGIARVCNKYKIPLLVDNAHGAYLAFCEENLHPIALGADMCCDSAHKTLPVLTAGSYLHCAKSDIYGFSVNIKEATALFGSTSPSYLIMQSLDLCNSYLNQRAKSEIAACMKSTQELRSLLRARGVADISDEPLKITVPCEDKRFFDSYGVEPEYADSEFAVLMISPFNSNDDFAKLRKALESLPVPSAKSSSPGFIKAEAEMSIRQAMFARSQTVKIEDALGRICAAPTVSCPPAIPIAVSGEVITREHIELFRYYNIENIKAVIQA